MKRFPSSQTGAARQTATLAFAAVLTVTGLSFSPAPAAADDGLPNGSSGRVHYDHYRDRGDRHDWRHRDRRTHRWNDRRADRRDGYRHGNRSASGTYSGNVSGYDDRGNGTYFYVERDGYYSKDSDDRRQFRPGPKVVTPGGGGSGCANPGSVCIIRPGD